MKLIKILIKLKIKLIKLMNNYQKHRIFINNSKNLKNNWINKKIYLQVNKYSFKILWSKLNDFLSFVIEFLLLNIL